MKTQCRACGSGRVIARAHLTSKSLALGRPAIAVDLPGISFIGVPPSSAVAATVCVDCGEITLRATDLEQLQKVYERVAHNGIRLNEPEPDAL
jgi:hypothetical protein